MCIQRRSLLCIAYIENRLIFFTWTNEDADGNGKEDIDDPVILHDIFNGFSDNPELLRRIDIARRITEKATEFIQFR